MLENKKIAITGAAGQIAYALLFRLVSGQLFGDATTIDLRLIDIEPALPALKAVVMELEDCAFPLLYDITVTADPRVGFKDADTILLVGAAPRKSGMERADLLKINAPIFSEQGKIINEVASSTVLVFVVGNPCNTNCLITMYNAPNVPNNRFFAMTTLDENRAISQLAKKAEVPLTAVKNMIIWGNHSGTQYPDFYHATINGELATNVIGDHDWLKNDFVRTIQQRGASVIKVRGGSSAASAANAIIDAVYQLTNNTTKNNKLSMACASNGQYNVDENLIFSFPARVDNGKFSIDNTIEHNQFGQQRLKETLEELRAEREAVKNLGFI